MMTEAKIQRLLEFAATEYQEALDRGEYSNAMYDRGMIVALQMVLSVDPSEILAQTAGTTAQAAYIHPEN